jgi:hypothetical protein
MACPGFTFRFLYVHMLVYMNVNPSSHYFSLLIPHWGWPKKAETCRRITTCLYAIVFNCFHILVRSVVSICSLYSPVFKVDRTIETIPWTDTINCITPHPLSSVQPLWCVLDKDHLMLQGWAWSPWPWNSFVFVCVTLRGEVWPAGVYRKPFC